MSRLIWIIHRFGCMRFLLELLSTKENSPEEKKLIPLDHAEKSGHCFWINFFGKSWNLILLSVNLNSRKLASNA